MVYIVKQRVPLAPHQGSFSRRSRAAICLVPGGPVITVLDDFNDGNITEYSGDTGSFAASTASKYEGAYGLEAALSSDARIYRAAPAVAQGSLLRFWTRFVTPAGTTEESRLIFGYQDATHYYTAGLSKSSNLLVLRKNNGGTWSVIGSVAVTPALDTWYRLSLQWNAAGEMKLTWSGGAQEASGTDNTWATGGFGWYGVGGTPSPAHYYWDYLTKEA